MQVNHYCSRCDDKGTVGFIFTKVCPECNGEPYEHWRKTHPPLRNMARPLSPPPPPKHCCCKGYRR
jgi:anaerobic ribonucleoside-triphosphate reductase